MGNIHQRVITAVVVFSLLLSGIVTTMAMDTPELLLYETRIDFMSAVGVNTGYGGSEDEMALIVSRADFAELLSVVFALDTGLASGKVFGDVPISHRSFESISSVCAVGMMNGFGDNNFYPDYNVSYEQVLKTLVVGLGYQVYAENKGGYPFGYLSVATQIGLAKGVNGVMGGNITRNMAVTLLYNALHTDLVEQKNYGVKNEYVTEKGKTILSERFDVYKIEGQISGNEDTRLTVPTPLSVKGQVEIDGKGYWVGGTNAKEFLGYIVTAYYHQEKNQDEKILLYLEMPESKNIIKYIDVKDIKSSINRIISYFDETGRNTTITIAADADILYNGKARPSYFVDNISNIDKGAIRFINTNKNGEYDVVIITESVNYVVNAVDNVNEIVYFKYDMPPLSLNKGGSEVKINIVKDFDEIDVISLKEWDVLSITADLYTVVNGKTVVDPDYTMCTINASSYSIIGTVSEISYDAGGYRIQVDDDVYTFSKEYPFADFSISSGDEGIFCFDIYGEIAAVDFTTKIGWSYGYLMLAKTESGISNVVQVRLLHEEGSFMSFDMAGNVEIDGKYYKRSGDILSLLTESAASEKSGSVGGLSQIIKYRIDSEGKIRAIDTIMENAHENDISKSNNLTHFGTILNAYYKSPNKSLGESGTGGNAYNIAAKFVMFVVCSTMNEDDFLVRKTDYFKGENTYFPNSGTNPQPLHVYDVDDMTTAHAGVFKIMSSETQEPSNSITKDTPIAVFNKMGKAINDKGEEVTKISVFVSGGETSFYLTYDLKIGENSNFLTGDVIRYSLDYFGNIEDIRKVLNVDGSTTPSTLIYKDNEISRVPQVSSVTPNPYAFNAQFRPIYGEVRSKSGSRIVIKSGDKVTTAYDLATASVYIVEGESGKTRITRGSVADIIPSNGTEGAGTKVLLHVKHEEIPLSIVIFKLKEENK